MSVSRAPRRRGRGAPCSPGAPLASARVALRVFFSGSASSRVTAPPPAPGVRPTVSTGRCGT
eukprot:3937241-Prymnesium_polylepis.1